MVESGKGRIQIGRFQSGVETLGGTQEQTRHELRNDGTRSQVCTDTKSMIIYYNRLGFGISVITFQLRNEMRIKYCLITRR